MEKLGSPAPDFNLKNWNPLLQQESYELDSFRITLPYWSRSFAITAPMWFISANLLFILQMNMSQRIGSRGHQFERHRSLSR